MIPVYQPYLPKEILVHAHEALDSTWISSKGPYITEVESKLSELHSVGDVRINAALTTNNGTSATHLVARLLRKRFPNIDTIIVPNNVYVAAWNAFLYEGYRLIAVDADLDTWNWDEAKLNELLDQHDQETTALLVVHNLGNIVNVPRLIRERGFVVVEDNCEGFLGRYEGYPAGSLSLASSISFFGNKNLTSGEGGAVISRTQDHGYLQQLRSQGQSSTRFVHDELGYNYRMTNIQAAILLGQIEVLDEVWKLKGEMLSLYQDLFEDIDEVSLQVSDKNTRHSRWMVGIRIRGNSGYDELEKFFHANYIDVRPMFYPISHHKHLKDVRCHGGEDVARLLNKECVVLPSYPGLKNHEIAHVVNTVKQYLVTRS